MNLDGAVNGLDVNPFVHAVISEPFNPYGDMTGDGVVTGLDVAPFVAAVIAGGAQIVPEPSTLALATIALLGLLCWQRKRR
ncbi:MAG: hypothetical protein A2W31_01030 [Planctomycetes bacterium RBG_16_64_10]|nr:MAG: hypothetical protein A2W31_01030 [Planctomycetes bacterium RBG_16_64_10]